VALVEDPVARDAFLARGASAIAVPESTLRDLALRARVGAAPPSRTATAEATSENRPSRSFPLIGGVARRS
jgi:hypothetical protein